MSQFSVNLANLLRGEHVNVGYTSAEIDAQLASAAAALSSFTVDVTLAEGVDLTLGTTTGTKIGTGATEKLGFYGATPVVQRTAYTQTYSTADKTHANPTAAVLTDNGGGGATDNTIGAITGDQSVKDAVSELADEINKLVADVADVKQLVNSVIDDLQSLGLFA